MTFFDYLACILTCWLSISVMQLPNYIHGLNYLLILVSFITNSPVELSLLFIGMLVQHHYHHLFSAGVLVGRYKYGFYLKHLNTIWSIIPHASYLCSQGVGILLSGLFGTVTGSSVSV